MGRRTVLCSWLVPITLAAGAVAAAQTRTDVDLTGAWTLEITMPGGTSAALVTLEQRGSVVSGEYQSTLLGSHKVQATHGLR